MQIIKEFKQQQHDLRKKDIEIIWLKQKIIERMLQRSESNCIIQKQLEKKIFKNKSMSEIVINKGVVNINIHSENLEKNIISSYCKECDIIKVENLDAINEESTLVKKNNIGNEEVITQRNQTYKLIQQTEHLKQTMNILKEETDNIDNMKKKLVVLYFLL